MARISPDMGAHKEHLLVRQGDSFAFTFTLKSAGELVDFTSCTALLQVREDWGDEERGKLPLLELTESNGITLGGATGVVSFRLTPAQTQELVQKTRRARYQLRITDSLSGIKATVLRGELRTDRSVIL